jgi:serine phosphatase RsbU (regulator of sigma subunit)
MNQADDAASTMATACLAEVDVRGSELRFIRAGHDSPLLITPNSVTALDGDHGPALGLSEPDGWPVQRMQLPPRAAIMLFTDGLTECRETPESARQFSHLAPRIDGHALLAKPPAEAIDEMLVQLFPGGTEQLDDDLAVILLRLRRAAT